MNSFMKEKIVFQGAELPPILHHGTTERFIEWYTQPDGLYRLPLLSYTIDAKSGDVRNWPKNYDSITMDPRATIVINTLLAYEGLSQSFTGTHVRFSHLPAGSFRVLRESEQSFEFGSGYNGAISNLEKELGC